MSIVKIEEDDIIRLSSHQVITSLAACVKELIENSLDSGAKTLEIAFKDYGESSFQVQDDGSGIGSGDFASIALRHYTSKIKSFNDLSNCCSYGFRGEALNSICSLSNLQILTCTNPPHGTLLSFDHNGNLIQSVAAARQKGTTVIVNKLFYSLPVRQQEFKRNLKSEFCKFLDLIHSYILSNNHVRFVVTNSTKNGKSNLITAPHSASLLQSITNLFGAKYANSLMEIKRLKLDSLCPDEQMAGMRLTGYISRPSPNCGLSTGNRQYFFINKRPLNLPKAKKLINELYRVYNSLQFPSFILNICLGEGFYQTPKSRCI